ncbi:MAG: 30S ribosomal protein S8 [Deltaproteobacteria bacterium]|jgi:small subunit ribosomal protein S8|nr:30S ribosomal protein S8 [Deltaproteobacteria bacterium]MDA8308516.1 30S ribosomal protein S8 [Deltaproteobacteria bacterium]
MMVSDPIGDFINRIRNAQKARFDKVDIPASRMKANLCRILKEEGFIKNYKFIRDDKQGILRINIKYGESREGALAGAKRISKSGRRVYVGHLEIPRVMNGMGISILSTSRGVMTDRQARKEGVGGEVLCAVW